MPIDLSGIVLEEVRALKTKLKRSLEAGNYEAAARYARQIAVLLEKYAETSSSPKSIMAMANEYDNLARRLRSKQVIVRGAGQGDAIVEGGERADNLDEEFEKAAMSLIAKADVTWDDIAGLEEAKKSLIEAIFYSIAAPDKPVIVEPPRRILLYGPPGTGKTMLAKAASNMINATFFYVSVDRILSRYLGDSPRMLAAVFRVARRNAPSIIFFDEVEPLAQRRDSAKETATGLVQTFLTELDGFNDYSGEPLLVIAATNKPWMLDEAIISRFDKKIYVPLPDLKTREKIFRLNLEKKGFEIEGITYRELAERTEGYSGREIAAVCKEAIMMMLRRANPDIYKKITKNRLTTESGRLRYRVLPIKREELLHAISIVKPIATKELIEKYEKFRRNLTIA